MLSRTIVPGFRRYGVGLDRFCSQNGAHFGGLTQENKRSRCSVCFIRAKYFAASQSTVSERWMTTDELGAARETDYMVGTSCNVVPPSLLTQLLPPGKHFTNLWIFTSHSYFKHLTCNLLQEALSAFSHTEAIPPSLKLTHTQPLGLCLNATLQGSLPWPSKWG